MEADALIGKHVPWKQVKNVHLRIVSHAYFAHVDEKDEVISHANGMPYATLTVQNGTHPINFMLPVAHRLDFFNLWTIYETRGVRDDEEVLVVYTPLGGVVGKLLGATQPHLTFLIYPGGHLDNIVDPSQPEAVNLEPLDMAHGLKSSLFSV